MEKKMVMVIDDDVFSLSTISECLKDHYQVMLFKRGKEALGFLEEHRVDLVLLDYVMPEMDGMQVFEAIQSLPECEELPVIFLSGNADRKTALRFLGAGADGYLVKPASKPELLETIEEVLEES